MVRVPSIRRITLAAATASPSAIVPEGATHVLLNPLSLTENVQVTFNGDNPNETGKFITLYSGQSLELTTPDASPFPQLQIRLYATNASLVDLTWY